MRRVNTPRHCTQPSPRSSSLTSLPSLRLPPSLTFTAKIHLASSSWSLARSRARPQLARLTPPLASLARDRALFFRCPSESPKEGKSHVWTRGKEGIDGEGSPREAVTASARALLINDCRRRVVRPSLRPSLRQSITVPLVRLAHVPAVRKSASAANVFSPAAAAALLLPLESSDSDPNPRSQSTTHARPLYPSLRPRHTRSLHRR